MPNSEIPAGIDIEAVTTWLSEQVHGLGGTIVPPLTFDQIAGGRSNLTFHVTDSAGSAWALRRPPTGPILPTAHDMAREHRVMSSLVSTSVPVPGMVGLCTNDAVNGAPFFVMDWVDGTVVRDSDVAEMFDLKSRRAMGISVVETLARIHRVNIDDVGLGNFAKRDGYVERQLRRWKSQLDATKSQVPSSIDRAHVELLSHMPEQGTVGLVHGDYRLDNTIIGSDLTVKAVLDWELTTLGDPLADVGAMLAYWSRPGDPVIALSSPPTLADGFIERDEVIDVYQQAIGHEVANIGYFHAFATWRLACILHGVVDRYRAGAMGDDDGFDPEEWATQVTALAETSLDILARSVKP